MLRAIRGLEPSGRGLVLLGRGLGYLPNVLGSGLGLLGRVVGRVLGLPDRLLGGGGGVGGVLGRVLSAL